jgi:hypothetical protein
MPIRFNVNGAPSIEVKKHTDEFQFASRFIF